MSTNKVNSLNIAYLFKTSVGSINGSWTEGNVSTVKKITLPNGKQLPYVSGQSLKYQIRQGLRLNGWADKFSPIVVSKASKSVNITKGIPGEFIDDDLFGYLNPKGDYVDENGGSFNVPGTHRRTAPVRVSAAVGVFPFKGDRDLGSKSKEKESGSSDAGGNLFETEIYYNYFRANILIELDRIGNFQDSELNGRAGYQLSPEEKKKRLKALIQSLEHIWGGGKQSRVLTDMAPKFLAITFQKAKSPIFLETITLTDEEELNTQAVNEVLSGNKDIIKEMFIGVQSGIFKNDVVKEIEGATTIQSAWQAAKEQLEKIEF
jgi:CRISPR-associated protein Cst2